MYDMIWLAGVALRGATWLAWVAVDRRTRFELVNDNDYHSRVKQQNPPLPEWDHFIPFVMPVK